MNKVAHRTRGELARRALEIQGFLAMDDVVSERESVSSPGAVHGGPPRPGRSRSRQAEIPSKTGGRGERRSGPRPMPHRMVLASWPDSWRERWGQRANALEDVGLSWRDAESRAFLEIRDQWRSSPEVVERN